MYTGLPGLPGLPGQAGLPGCTVVQLYSTGVQVHCTQRRNKNINECVIHRLTERVIVSASVSLQHRDRESSVHTCFHRNVD